VATRWPHWSDRCVHCGLVDGHCGPELSMGLVYPRVGLGWVGLGWVGLGRVGLGRVFLIFHGLGWVEC